MTVAVDTITRRAVPGIRGVHAVAIQAANSYTLGISADADLLLDSRLRPPVSFGLRVGFEDGASTGLIDAYKEFTTVDLLARLSIGGRSAEMSLFAGGAWIRKYMWGYFDGTTERTAILPKVGVEVRWMFVPKYAGLVARVSTTTNELLGAEVEIQPDGRTKGFTQVTGGLGLILGWEP